MTTREMLSVGIDVGTTTSQVVFSRLTVRNSHRLGLVPRIEIDARAVLHQSRAHPTPLSGPDEVDVDRLLAIVREEFTAAGLAPTDVETGAVIITGETARTRNAEAILAAVSGLAGDFVVTVAGPNLEAQIAGRGAGAAAYSAAQYTTAVNVDVGGGSANAAVFRSGRHLASAAIMVGGRQLTLDAASGTVTHLAPSGRTIVADRGIDLVEGRRAGLTELRRLSDVMADLIVDLIDGEDRNTVASIALTPPLPPLSDEVTAIFLSGGVGRAYYDEDPADSLREIAAYGDIGPLLARSLRESPRMRALPVRRPAETLRATVLGAASQTVTLSGSTIWTREELLPLRNLPVVEPVIGDPVPEVSEVAASLARAMSRWDRDHEGVVALALSLPEPLDYRSMTRVAEGVASFCRDRNDGTTPVVLVTEHDYAQVLGQSITALTPDLPLVAIDQIGLGEGDFIDIGSPMLDGRVVPVSVKTLVFYQ